MIRLKHIYILILLLFSIHGFSQKVEYISKYFTRYKKGTNYFKIGSHKLSFDSTAVYLNKKIVIEKDSSSNFFLEVFEKKILVVSYYPMSQAHVATGPGFRPMQKVELILLDDPDQRWFFDVKGAFNSEAIIGFDEKTGELFIKRKVVGKKIPTSNIDTNTFGSKELKLLNHYERSIETDGNSSINNYDNLNLTQRFDQDKISIYITGKKIYELDVQSKDIQQEVFDNKFLLISYTMKPSNAAGIDQFKRDSTIVIDLTSGLKEFVSLPLVYLTRSAYFLKGHYAYLDEVSLNQMDIPRYFAIDSIDLASGKVLLMNQGHYIIERRLTKINE